MSAAQTLGFSSFGAAAAGAGAAPTGAWATPHARPASEGTELMLSTMVKVPLPASIAYCVTWPDSSLSYVQVLVVWRECEVAWAVPGFRADRSRIIGCKFAGLAVEGELQNAPSVAT